MAITPSKEFDATRRAQERENRPITLGDRESKPARKTPKIMRRFRALVREDAKLARESDGLNGQGELFRLAREEGLLLGDEDSPRELSAEDRSRLAEIEVRRKEIDEAHSEDDEGRLAEIEDRREEIVYEMVLLLVEPKDGGELPLDYVTDNVDIEEVRDLLGFLSPQGEPDADPTTETPATSS